MRGPMDAIFIRNVMIYFDEQTRDRLLKEAVGLLKQGGFLFLGHSEGIAGTRYGLKYVRPSIYVKEN